MWDKTVQVSCLPARFFRGGLTQVVHLDGAHSFDGVARRAEPSILATTHGRAGLMAACTMCSDEIAEPRHLSRPVGRNTLTCSAPACAREASDLWRKRQAARA